MWFDWMEYWHKEFHKDYKVDHVPEDPPLIRFLTFATQIISWVMLLGMVVFVIYAAF